jgi:hypothetical protein
MDLLDAMYPGARFIHITRSPFEVVPSTIHMWDIVARENALKRGWQAPSCREVAEVLKAFLEGIRRQAARLAPGHYAEIAFADLERDPAGTLQNMFRELNLPYPPDFERRVKEFASQQANYRKNTHRLRPEDRECLHQVFGTTVAD